MHQTTVSKSFHRLQDYIAHLTARLDMPQAELIQRITITFILSFILLTLHILDDAFVTNEPSWYGIGVSEFLFYLFLIFAVLPPIGLWMLRRGNIWGIAILVPYAFQALYGAGLNHIRHLFGDFRGSQLLPGLSSALHIQIGNPMGHGILSLFAGMSGLIGTPPHSHTIPSTIVVFVGVGVNITLLGLLGLALLNSPHWHTKNTAVPAKQRD